MRGVDNKRKKKRVKMNNYCVYLYNIVNVPIQQNLVKDPTQLKEGNSKVITILLHYNPYKPRGKRK